MCGIAGYLLRTTTRASPDVPKRLLEGIRVRGPDDEGICLIDRARNLRTHLRTERTVAALGDDLAHLSSPAGSVAHDLALIGTRYAIQDRSPAGHQPFSSADHSIIAVFNGEIYNFIEVRAELEAQGIPFRTRCDTEVLVEGYRRWREELWPRLNGFWAAAIFDSSNGCLTLSRDRLGVAPLYYRETPAGLYFASSITPLRRIEPTTAAVDPDRVTGFIETALKDIDEATLYREVHSVPPATTMDFPKDNAGLAQARVRRFWTLPSERLSVADLSLDEAAQSVRDTLFAAVELRLRADVPVAFELSGGLDSSSIVAAAATLRGDGLRTYTIEVPEENEEPIARTMLKMHRLDYRVLKDPESDFLSHALRFAKVLEEPYHSPNIYTHFQMRKRMKAEGVAVVVSGSGGDEVLAGYEYLFWDQASRAMREGGQRWNAMRYQLAKWQQDLRSGRRTLGLIRGSAKRIANSLGIRRGSRRLGDAGALGMHKGNQVLRLHGAYPSLEYDDQRRYHFEVGLLPYYLRSNDHFTMEIPLEHRFPFLDVRLVELGLRMPPSYLFHAGWTKYVLRKAMESFLPEEIVWRREKMGFPFPYRRFLTEHESVLTSSVDRVRAAGFLPAESPPYAALLRADPVRLWRVCSTGIWLSMPEVAS